MCGIVGFRNRDEPAAADQVLRMLSTIEYRGPDARGAHTSGATGLGAVRLSVINPGPEADQPFATEDGSGVLVYNGELYGADRLRARLGPDVRWRTRCDTEVLLRAFGMWGVPDTLPLLDGIFAFAYHDLTTGDLWLGRDRLGVKPLYAARVGQALVFGSEVKTVLAHPAVPREPNVLALVAGLVLDNLEEPWTAFKGVDAVPRGSAWRVDADNQVTEFQYWDVLRDLDLDRLAAARRRPERDAVAELDAVLRRTVDAQLASDAPLAVLCSGGIDSGLIAAYTAARSTDSGSPVPAYVADVVGAKPEAERAARVAGDLGLPLRPVRVTEDDYLRLWPKAVWLQDYPICVPSDPAFLAVTTACGEAGIKVVLSGEGADELFCGYPWQIQAGRAWRWWSLLRRVRPGGRLGGLLGLPAPGDARALRAHTFGNFDVPDPFQDLREACALHGGHEAMRHKEILHRLRDVGTPAERGLLAASVNSMYGHLGALLLRADRMGMGASVETRVPYLGNEVVDLAMHLPMRVKYRGGQGKRVLRGVARRHLAAAVVDAPKWGFATNRAAYRFAAPLIRGGIAPELLGWTSRTTDYLLDELLGASKPVVLFLLASLELWGRVFLGGQSPEELGAFLVAQRSHDLEGAQR